MLYEVYNIVQARTGDFHSDLLIMTIILVFVALMFAWIWRLPLRAGWPRFMKRLWLVLTVISVLSIGGSMCITYFIDIQSYNAWIEKKDWTIVEGILNGIDRPNGMDPPHFSVGDKRFEPDEYHQPTLEATNLDEGAFVRVYYHENLIVKIETAFRN